MIADLSQEWPLDPAVTYLNHGTLGVAPRRVLQRQREWRDRIEAAPARMLAREIAPNQGDGLLRESAGEVAAWLGAQADDVAFVDNASTGIAVVLRSIDWRPGDEVLLTDHGYGTVRRALEQVPGLTIRTVEVPYPAFDAAELLARVDAGFTERTRLLLVDHVPSESALIFPVRDLCRLARDRGVLSAVDGAHVPGHLALDVPSVGADVYMANLHKWALAPRGTGVLWVAPALQDRVRPLVTSWNDGWPRAFDWPGTRDPSGWLTAPFALTLLEDASWCHDLAVRAAQELPEAWGTVFEAPLDTVGRMVSLPLPTVFDDTARLRRELLDEDAIEVQAHHRSGRGWIRICLQTYNDWSDVERLRDAVLRRLP